LAPGRPASTSAITESLGR